MALSQHYTGQRPLFTQPLTQGVGGRANRWFGFFRFRDSCSVEEKFEAAPFW